MSSNVDVDLTDGLTDGLTDERTHAERDFTLARAVETVEGYREECLSAVRYIQDESQRTADRLAAIERHARREASPIDRADVAFLVGSLSVAAGVAVAFHWAYSLIAVGALVTTLSLIRPLASVFRARTNTKR